MADIEQCLGVLERFNNGELQVNLAKEFKTSQASISRWIIKARKAIKKTKLKPKKQPVVNTKRLQKANITPPVDDILSPRGSGSASRLPPSSIPQDFQDKIDLMVWAQSQGVKVNFSEIVNYHDKTNQLQDQSDTTDISQVQSDELERVRDKLFI